MMSEKGQPDIVLDIASVWPYLDYLNLMWVEAGSVVRLLAGGQASLIACALQYAPWSVSLEIVIQSSSYP
jgi:hypothetical protein